MPGIYLSEVNQCQCAGVLVRVRACVSAVVCVVDSVTQ